MSDFAKDTNVPTNDCISRQAAIRWVKTECNPYGKPTLDFESGKKVMEHLEQMPSVEPKKGKWTDKEVFDEMDLVDEWQTAKCSVCGKFHTTPYMYSFDNFKYCPHCGSQMEVTE